MIAKSYIESNLRSLDAKYRRTNSDKESLFFAKLALLELCGWIEESMDDIVLRYAKKHLKVQANFKKFHDDYVVRTYGFDYERNFREMLIRLIGITGVERLESGVDPLKLDLLKSHLGTLKVARNRLAHTHIRGTTMSIAAPSNTIDAFRVVFDGLTEYQAAIRVGGF